MYFPHRGIPDLEVHVSTADPDCNSDCSWAQVILEMSIRRVLSLKPCMSALAVLAAKEDRDDD
jgi:hypothetical protein